MRTKVERVLEWHLEPRTGPNSVMCGDVYQTISYPVFDIGIVSTVVLSMHAASYAGQRTTMTALLSQLGPSQDLQSGVSCFQANTP